jgi:hypothetical protein
MVLDVLLVSKSCFYSSLPDGAFVLVRIHLSCDIKAGHHIYVDQSGGYWSMTKKESIDAV